MDVDLSPGAASKMGAYDTVVVAIVLVATFWGWRKGLATQVASIVSMAASFFVAVRFREPLAAKIDAEEPWNRFAAMLILFLGTSLVIWTFFRQIRVSIERMKLGDFDRQLGALFGAAKGVVIAGLVTMFSFTLLDEPQRRLIIDSKSGVWIAKFMDQATAIMPEEFRRFVRPYLENLDRGLGSPGWPPESPWPGNVSGLPDWGAGGRDARPTIPPAPWGRSPQVPPVPGERTDGLTQPPANGFPRSAEGPGSYEFHPANRT